MRLILGWLVLTIAVLVAVPIVPGIDVDWTPGVYLVIAAVFGLVNVALGAVLRPLSVPLLIPLWALLSFVLNAIVLLITDSLVGSLEVEDFWAALAGVAIITLMAAAVEGVTRALGTRVTRSV